MSTDRYHLTLFSGGRPVVHGWWADRTTADRKFTRWVGEYSDVDRARIALVDTVTGQVIHRWPDEA